jgi:hypothetical protein
MYWDFTSFLLIQFSTTVIFSPPFRHFFSIYRNACVDTFFFFSFFKKFNTTRIKNRYLDPFPPDKPPCILYRNARAVLLRIFY